MLQPEGSKAADLVARRDARGRAPQIRDKALAGRMPLPVEAPCPSVEQRQQCLHLTPAVRKGRSIHQARS